MLEAKKLKLGAGTRGFDEALLRARTQAENYARALPASEGRPPFVVVVVVDVGQVIELYAEFTRSGATYTPLPDSRSHRLPLARLRKPAVRERLRLLWQDPMALDPARASAKVTREVAARLAALAKDLEEAAAPSRVVQREFVHQALELRPGGGRMDAEAVHEDDGGARLGVGRQHGLGARQGVQAAEVVAVVGVVHGEGARAPVPGACAGRFCRALLPSVCAQRFCRALLQGACAGRLWGMTHSCSGSAPHQRANPVPAGRPPFVSVGRGSSAPRCGPSQGPRAAL